jgi:hypothetical protein
MIEKKKVKVKGALNCPLLECENKKAKIYNKKPM